MPIARVTALLLALLFVSVGFRWESQHFLPGAVRGAGIAVVLVLIAPLARRGWLRALDRLADATRSRTSLAVTLLAVTSFALTVGLAFFVHRPYPHISDGFAYYFQAKIFAAGALFAPAPPVPESFQFEWIAVHDGRWFSIFPPGWPALLAAGVRLGIPVLVNPILGALCIVAIYKLGKTLFGPVHGLVCALFCCLSPFFLFMSSEFMSHTAALLFTSLSTLMAVQAADRPSPGRFATAGALAGVGFLIRPPDALAIWLAQTAHGMWTRRSREMFGGALVSAAALSGAIGLYLAYNRVLVGTWFSAPLLLVSPNNRLGFGPDIGYPIAFPTPGHSPWRALLNLNHNAAVMSQDLFGWPVTSLFFVVLVAVLGKKDARHTLGFAIIAAVVAIYALFWYHGEAYGARFYFTLLPYLLMLSVDGMRQTPEIIARWFPRLESIASRAHVAAAVVLCFVFGWTVYVPKVSLVAPYYNHKGVNSGFAEFRRRLPADPAIVLVDAPAPLYYGPALIANDLPIGAGPIIYARDLDEEANARLLAAFPGRRLLHYTYQPQANPVRTWLDSLIRDAGLSR